MSDRPGRDTAGCATSTETVEALMARLRNRADLDWSIPAPAAAIEDTRGWAPAADPASGVVGHRPAPGAAPAQSPLPTAAAGPSSAVRAHVLAYRVLAALGTALALLFVRFTDDTSFITWRYGRTFARTWHWNWNPTGPRVEAYSSFLYAAAAAIPAWLHIPVELFFKGVALGVLAGYVMWTRRLGLPRTQHLVLLAVAVASPVFFIQLFSGAETVMFTLTVTVLFAALHRDGRLRPKHYAIAVAMCLLRPEGIAYAAAVAAWALVLDRGKVHRRGALVLLVGVVEYWFWRAQEFGWFWPNSLYAGSRDGSALDQFQDSADHVLPAAFVTILVVSAAALLAARATRVGLLKAGLRRLGAESLREATPLVLALTSAALVLTVDERLNLSTDYANRYLWQAVFPVVAVVLCKPLLTAPGEPRAGVGDRWSLAATVVAAATAATDLTPGQAGQGVLLAALVVVGAAVVARILLRDRAATAVGAVGLAALVSWVSLPTALGYAGYRNRLDEAHQALGAVVRDLPFNGSIAVADAGVLAFEQPRRVIDLEGRADAAVAHRTFTGTELDAAKVRVVIAASSTPDVSGVRVSNFAQRKTYAWAAASGFRFFTGPQFSDHYWLDLWIDPRVITPTLLADLDRIRTVSARADREGDLSVLVDHLLDLPMLHDPTDLVPARSGLAARTARGPAGPPHLSTSDLTAPHLPTRSPHALPPR